MEKVSDLLIFFFLVFVLFFVLFCFVLFCFVLFCFLFLFFVFGFVFVFCFCFCFCFLFLFLFFVFVFVFCFLFFCSTRVTMGKALKDICTDKKGKSETVNFVRYFRIASELFSPLSRKSHVLHLRAHQDLTTVIFLFSVFLICLQLRVLASKLSLALYPLMRVYYTII